MSKIRRRGYVLLAWKSDHGPRHVHVYKESKLIVKWDLENDRAMKGTAPRSVVELIRELQREGRL